MREVLHSVCIEFGVFLKLDRPWVKMKRITKFTWCVYLSSAFLFWNCLKQGHTY